MFVDKSLYFYFPYRRGLTGNFCGCWSIWFHVSAYYAQNWASSFSLHYVYRSYNWILYRYIYDLTVGGLALTFPVDGTEPRPSNYQFNENVSDFTKINLKATIYRYDMFILSNSFQKFSLYLCTLPQTLSQKNKTTKV